MTFNVIQGQTASAYLGGLYEIGATTGSPSGYPVLTIYLPVSTLVGYTGGPMDSNTQPQGYAASNITLSSSSPNPDDYLNAGSLAPVPEPSAALLGLGGLLALGLLHRKIVS